MNFFSVKIPFIPFLYIESKTPKFSFCWFKLILELSLEFSSVIAVIAVISVVCELLSISSLSSEDDLGFPLFPLFLELTGS